MRIKFRVVFRERIAEWIASGVLFLWGIIFALHTPEGSRESFYTSLQLIMPLKAWGILAIIVGLFRLIALYINGYWRPTAHFRAFGGGLGTLLWGTIIISFITAGSITGSIAAFFGFLLFDLSAIWYAAADAKVADNAAHNKRLSNGNITA